MTSPQIVFHRTALRRRKARAVVTRDSVSFLKERVLDDIADRLLATGRTFQTGLCLGALTTDSDPTLSGRIETLVETDLTNTAGRGHLPVIADEEWLPFAEDSFDLVISPLALHWVNDLPGSLIQINKALKPDGYFVGAMLGGATLTELRQCLLQAEAELTGGAIMRVSPFADALDMSQLLQRAGFALPVSDRDRLTIRYDTLFGLLNDLKASGETHAPADPRKRGLSRRILLRAAELYAEQFADPDGRLRVTVDIIWMTGWRPHASQPKAKRPGSASVRLADALGVTEESAGEKTGVVVKR